ncbi:hypothetical protein CTZ27_32885 [Streptomyces griseocarneus]|nr:hypothetical protein CTZ27_32885 [Streptomyces griseocarneus]
MGARDRALCVFYGLYTVVGFVAMGWMAVDFIVGHSDGGTSGVIGDFLRDATTNLATKFVYADLTLVWIALAGFMISEARRHRIRFVWAYIIGAPLLALAVSFPLFMLVRQLKLAAPGAGVETQRVRVAAE